MKIKEHLTYLYDRTYVKGTYEIHNFGLVQILITHLLSIEHKSAGILFP